MRPVLVLLALLGGPALAQAQPAPASALAAGFSLPSGRLQCMYDDSSGPASIRCDVLNPTFRVARPASCPLDYGDSVTLNVTGRPLLGCHGDTVVDPQRPVLAYQRFWQRAGLTCQSSTAGVRCINIDGHGFELSRARYRLF
ncbi:DUF6636 domain-containing protein [Deinococcus sonorensis]|uniref:DUF6636 domain-containing protein n=2 Tax=Deinococcus sonorensis TaxID=309891 RepID=A0AAU7UBY7_9DEIO